MACSAQMSHLSRALSEIPAWLRLSMSCAQRCAVEWGLGRLGLAQPGGCSSLGHLHLYNPGHTQHSFLHCSTRGHGCAGTLVQDAACMRLCGSPCRHGFSRRALQERSPDSVPREQNGLSTHDSHLRWSCWMRLVATLESVWPEPPGQRWPDHGCAAGGGGFSIGE
jgi:hypothetical protein